MSTEQTQTTAQTHEHTATASSVDHWKDRLENLLKSKNFDELKSELGKIAGEVQTEIQNFDLNAHLSPSAKKKVKELEKRYNEVLRNIQKAQKQFDREFNKTLRTFKKTRTDAEKRLGLIKKKVGQHKAKLAKVVKKNTPTKKKNRKKATSTKKKASRK
jgi:hypothetical protein